MREKRTSRIARLCWRREWLRWGQGWSLSQSFTRNWLLSSVCIGTKQKTKQTFDISSRDVAKFVRDRNVVGSSHGFLERVLSAEEVITPERCQKYYISCQRCQHIMEGWMDYIMNGSYHILD